MNFFAIVKWLGMCADLKSTQNSIQYSCVTHQDPDLHTKVQILRKLLALGANKLTGY